MSQPWNYRSSFLCRSPTPETRDLTGASGIRSSNIGNYDPYARGRIVARFGALFQSKLDDRVFRATLKMAAHQNARPSLALRHLENIQQLFASPAFLALLDLPWSPLFFAAIFILHPMLGWLALAGGAVLIAVALTNQLMTNKRVANAQSLSQRAHGFADQARLAHEIVQSQGMLGTITSRWSRQREDAQREVLSSSDWTGSFTALTKSMRLFLQSAMLAVGAYLVLEGEVTGGAMIASSILLGRALAPIEQSLGQWALVQRARQAWVSLSELLDVMPAETQKTALPAPNAELSVKNMMIAPPGAKAPTLSRRRPKKPSNCKNRSPSLNIRSRAPTPRLQP